MPSTQYIKTTDSNGTSNLTHLLNNNFLHYLLSIRPYHLQRVFGPGEDINIPEKGYTDPEWYFRSSDGCVWGIGWRWGQTRLRGRGATRRGKHFFTSPSPDSAAEFVQFINNELGA